MLSLRYDSIADKNTDFGLEKNFPVESLHTE